MTEILAWAELSGNVVYSWEYDILMSMDTEYCRETNLELEDMRAREEAKAAAENGATS